jgi:sigma-E factor negative regulatory protein RseB
MKSQQSANFLVAFGLLAAALVWPTSGWAQTAAPAPGALAADASTSVNEWLQRMHEASLKKRSFIGTLVQSSKEGMSSARIWHTCDGSSQIERVEALSGAPRSTIRQDGKLVTFIPELKLARVERRDDAPSVGGSASAFPDLLKSGAHQIPEFYSVKSLGSERIAGLEADVVQLSPRDTLRYGYRIWTERKSALVLKMQTLDANGAVLEQTAFSELQLDAPVKADKLKGMMKPAEGWKVEQTEMVKTTAAAEGWTLKATVPGFKGVSCHKRSGSQAAGETIQWVFSDGLATVSLFLEAYDKARHAQEGVASTGATNSLFRRMQDHFLIAVGEVPPQTLRSFAQALERKK